MSDTRKERIIEAATASFSNYGFKGTTIESVAKIAKVGKGTVYTYFEGKEELFDEIVNKTIKQMMTVANESVRDNVALHENIRYVLEAILTFRQNHSFIFKMIQEARELHTIQIIKTLEKIDDEIIGYLKELIEEQIQNGESVQQDPELLAFLLFKTFHLLTFEWTKKHPPLSSDKMTEILQRQVY
jgi:AcrR family transcriptional regulator